MTHILLLEDDAGTATEIALELVANGYDVTPCARIADGFRAARDDGVDLLIVDRQLPDGEGLDLIERLRAEGRRTPALVLSALGSLDDRVRGLRAGGDDYLAKPFALIELVARVQALLRRPNESRDTRLIVGPLDLDLLAGTATRAGRALDLLPRNSSCSTISSGVRGGSSRGRCCSRTCGGIVSSPTATSSMSISGGCAARSMPRGNRN